MTYQLNSMVGRFAGGLPSVDAAIAIAIDYLRYDENVIDDPNAEATLAAARRSTIVTRVEPYEECMGPAGQSYIVVECDGRDEFGIHDEHRCPTCQRPGWQD